MFYNEEQIKIAKNTDLIKFIESYGYQVKQEKNAYRILGIEGGLYIFNKNQTDTQGFYWHKKNVKGNAIDFCKEIFNDDYKSAIARLLNQSVQPLDSYKNNCPTIGQLKEKTSVQSLDSNKNFILPERDNNIKQAYSYLVKTRGISKNLINNCIKYGLIRQFKENNHIYVGFVGKDKNNNPKYLMLRSTLTNSNFKKEYINSDKKYGFKIFNIASVQPLDSKTKCPTIGQEEKASVQPLDSSNNINIYIFESPIDLLSYMTLNPAKTLKNNVFLSMGGISTLALKQFIEDYNPNIGSINVCFDADEVGQENANKVKAEYSSKYKVNILKPIYKDYNKQLLLIKQEASVQSLDSIKEEKSIIKK